MRYLIGGDNARQARGVSWRSISVAASSSSVTAAHNQAAYNKREAVAK